MNWSVGVDRHRRNAITIVGKLAIQPLNSFGAAAPDLVDANQDVVSSLPQIIVDNLRRSEYERQLRAQLPGGSEFRPDSIVIGAHL